MTTVDTTYNGYTNYETWAVSLHISNEQSSSEFWQHISGAMWRNADIDRPNYFSRSEYARINLAESLKERIEEAAPDLGATMYADLLNAAFSEVDWADIADNLLSDTEGYESL